MIKLKIKRSSIAGRGYFAESFVPKGTLIKVLKGKKFVESEIDALISRDLLNPDDDLQLDESSFLILDKDSYYFNHSCNPNSGIKGDTKLTAIRDIRPGEEITFDYSTTSGWTSNKTSYNNLDWFMDCKCGEPICRKEVGHVSTLPGEILKRYFQLNIVPDFIKGQLKNFLRE